jgi:hypothetical protein
VATDARMALCFGLKMSGNTDCNLGLNLRFLKEKDEAKTIFIIDIVYKCLFPVAFNFNN